MAPKKEGGTTLTGSPAVLGSFFMSLALTVYVVAQIFSSIDRAGLSATANTTLAAIEAAGYGALAMSVIIGIMLVANILMGLMRGMSGNQ